MDAKNVMKIRDLYAGYVKGNHILQGVNLDVHENEIIAIVGQNGAGKSTLAKAIMGFIPERSGAIELMSHAAPHKDIVGAIGFLMQNDNVFDNMTISENLRFAGRKLDKNAFTNELNTVRELFDVLLKDGYARRKASYLSGGEKHQLALAMVMLQNPALYVLDEPSAGLSPDNRKKIFASIRELRSLSGKSIILIEQNVNEAIKIADRVALLKLGKIDKIEYTNKIQNIDEFFWK